MRLRLLVAGCLLMSVAACNVFRFNTNAPPAFQGWFHVERPGRAGSVAFGSQNLADIRDLGCDRALSGETVWTQDGDALVLAQEPGSPRFTQDSSTQGALVANPGLFGTAAEQWLPGANCLVCPRGDAGVVVSCNEPAVLDGGT